MLLRGWTLVVWALVAASALFWGFRLFSRPLPVPTKAQLAEPGAALRGDLSRLLGAEAAPPAPSETAPAPADEARFALIGVVNPKPAQAAREGLALIAVDGKPPRAYRVGALIEGTHVLKSVSARGATLGLKDGGTPVALHIAPVAVASTGTLPAAASPMTPRAPSGQRVPTGPRPLGPHGSPVNLQPAQAQPTANQAGEAAPSE